jgi:CHAT domain-containing protein/tetratricopeptide (TPR) repeat protein
MFKSGTGGRCFFVFAVILLFVGQAAIATPELEQWNQGLVMLDEGQISASAIHFYTLFEQSPNRLDLLDGCFRVEHRRSHADSILIHIQNRVRPPLTPGGVAFRFVEAEALRGQGQFTAAADSFQSLAGTCLSLGDPLSALTAARKAARSRFDSRDLDQLQSSVQEMERLSKRVPYHPRMQTEIEVMIANTHFRLDELDKAEAMYRSVLDFSQSHKFLELQCKALNALGSIMSKQRRQTEAYSLYDQAQVLAREMGDNPKLCMILANLGYEETNLRKLAQARTHLLEADTLATTWGLHSSLGAIQSGLGAVAEREGDRVEAVRRFSNAIDLSVQTGNIFIELGSRQRMAYNLSTMGEYPEALAQYEICLDILNKRGGKFILNWVLVGLAEANHKLGYLDRASEYYRQGHAVNMEMGDKKSASRCLISMGLIHAQRGNYRQALVSQHQALMQYENLGDEEGASDAHASIAEVYLQLGDFHEALQHCKTAITQAKEANAEELLHQASQIMASIYSCTNQPELAEQNFLRVIEIARSWNDLMVEIWALNSLAEHYLTQGRKGEALDRLDQAQALLADREYIHPRSETCRLMARAADSPGQAVEWARQAASLATAGGFPEQEWKSFSDLGEYHLQLGQFEEAEEMQLRAVSLVESLRRQVGSDELRRHMLRPALLPYERLVGLYQNEFSDPAAAFVTSERSRAQILAGRLHAALAHESDKPPRTTDPEERDLAATITFLQSRLQENNLDQGVRDSLRDQIAELENDFDLLKLRWSAEEGVDATLLFPESPRAGQLQGVLNPGEHLLSYFMGTERSFLFSVSRSKVKAYALPARGLLEEKIHRFLLLQKQSLSGGENIPESVLATARQKLYALLVGPAENDYSGKTTLVIVPDGIMHRLPFAYLHDGENFLFEKHETFTAPSLQTLGFLRQRFEGRPTSKGRSAKRVFAIGCGGTGEESPANPERLHPFTDAPIPLLPNVDDEAWRLAGLFDNAQVLTGDFANEGTIRSGVLAGADLIHIAAHSYADEVDSRRSYILLNRSVGARADSNFHDGLLLWHEIVALDLNASLTTLASCRSAGGVLTRGEGVMGLTQAFLYAGSRCVLASQTNVPDLETSWFMDRFYRNLRTGSNAAEALRAVRLAVLAESGSDGQLFPETGFILTGDGTATYTEASSQKKSSVQYAGAAVFLLLIFLFAAKRPRRG